MRYPVVTKFFFHLAPANMRFGDCVTNRKIGTSIDPILNGQVKTFDGPKLTTKECQMINTDEDLMHQATEYDTKWIVSSTGEDTKSVPQDQTYFRYTEVKLTDKKIKKCQSDLDRPPWYWILDPNTEWK